MSITAVNGSSAQWELVKAPRTNKTSHAHHQLAQQKVNGDKAQFAFKVVNQQLDSLFLEQKNDLRKEIVSAIGPKGLRQKFAVNRAVNGILNHPGFQAYFKLMMLQTLKGQAMAQHQRAHLLEGNRQVRKTADPRFAGGFMDWITGRKKMVEDSTNQALDLATSDLRKRQQTDYLSDVMYGAYQQTKSRIAQDVQQYCGDNAVPLGLIAGGAMLPGTIGQVVSAGGLQLLLPDGEQMNTAGNIGLGAALTTAGGYLESGWLSGVLSGAGLLRASLGALDAADNSGLMPNVWTAVPMGLSVAAGQPALGWFLPQGPAAQALLVSGLSVWPIVLGNFLDGYTKKHKNHNH